jgi:hypothetical protein
MPLDTCRIGAEDEDSAPTLGLVRAAGATIDDIERDRIDRYLYSRPPADVIGAAALAGLRDPARQM